MSASAVLASSYAALRSAGAIDLISGSQSIRLFRIQGRVRMADIFISHIEEDRSVALEIAAGIEAAGYSTWYYERDCDPGFSYLVQIYQAIEQSAAVVLVISAQSLNSKQVTSEVVVAHESGKHFVPVLHGMTHADFQHRQAEWRMALAAASTIPIPVEGASSVVPRITAGLKRMGLTPGGDLLAGEKTPSVVKEVRSAPLLIAADAAGARHRILKRFSRRTFAIVSVSLVILLSVGVLVYTTAFLRRVPPKIIETAPDEAQEAATPAAQSNVSQSPSPQASEAKNANSVARNQDRRKALDRSQGVAGSRNASGGGAGAPVKNSNRNAAAGVSLNKDETPASSITRSIGGLFGKKKPKKPE